MSENKEFKQMYEKLDKKTRTEVDSLEKEEWKIEVLKILSDNVILELYKNMKPLTKQKIDSLNIIVKEIYKGQQKLDSSIVVYNKKIEIYILF